MTIDALRRESAPLWPIALARIAIGVLWLLSLRWKLPPDFAPDAGRGLLDYLQMCIRDRLYTQPGVGRHGPAARHLYQWG